MDDHESIERLKRWGLNELQSKVYLALGSTNGGGRVRQISKLASVNRAETYKVLSDLEEFGLVEVVLERPRLYRLRDPMQVFPSLLTKRKHDLQTLEQEMSEIAAWISSRPKMHSLRVDESSERSSAVVLGGSLDAVLNRVANEWKHATSEIISIIGRKNMMQMIEPFLNHLVGDLYRQGVTFKVLTEITPSTTKAIQLILDYAEIRHEGSVGLEFDIIDRQTLLLLLLRDGVSSHEPLLLITRDRAFVDTMIMLFRKLWDHSLPADMMIASSADGSQNAFSAETDKIGEITELRRKGFADLVATEAMRFVLAKSPREFHEAVSGICGAWLNNNDSEHYTTLEDFYVAHQNGNTALAKLEGKSLSLGKGFFALMRCPCLANLLTTGDQELRAAICELHRQLVREYADKVTIGSRKLRALLSPKPGDALWKFEAGDESSDRQLKRLRQLSEYYGCVVAFT